MRFAALWLNDFSLHSLLRSEAALSSLPVAIIRGEGRRAVVEQATAAATGVTPGLAVTLASARCPGLQLREPDPAAETEVQQLLVAAAFSLSPRVESTAPGCCTVDLLGADPDRTQREMHRLAVELRQLGLPVCIGAGETPLLARLAAQRANPILIIGDRSAFLHSLPLALAEPTPQQAAILQDWGIRTLGELTALPKAEVSLRLGREGVLLWERARGETQPVLKCMEPAQTFAASWSYEPPVECVEPLLFKLHRFAERIALELRGAGFVAEVLSLELELEKQARYERRFHLPEPGTRVDSWLRVLRTHLDTLRLQERIVAVRLEVLPSRIEQRQEGLFDTGLLDPQAFWENLARLGALIGDDRVGTPVLLNSHAPDAFRLDRPAAAVPAAESAPVHPARGGLLRRIRPPQPIQVCCEEDIPAALHGPVQGVVRAHAGPYILSGDWWKPGRWAVEMWHVELTSGGLYQLTRNSQGWWIDGVLG